MTRDIVAIFSCSLDSNGNFKEYHVVSGSTFSDEYNETLNSGSIILSQVYAKDRLRLRPKLRYEFVKIYDKNPVINDEPFERYYIVDNYNEKEINIKEHIFQYTIQLMSETKILEKIQCPNLAITHKVNEDGTTTKKSIYQYIKQYMELYVPKFKFTDDSFDNPNYVFWDYEPLIKLPEGDENDNTTPLGKFKERFSLLCADMTLTAPTMRQLLTSLMQQVGCIPTVNNRTLGFLDFQVEATQFGNGDYTVNNTINYVQRACSSDSAANNLVKMNSNVLDSSNKVIVETLGFRDRNNAFLKQTQNLKLETTFPIYKVEEVLMKTAVSLDGVNMGSALDSDGNWEISRWKVSDQGQNFTVGYTLYPNSPSIEYDSILDKNYAKVILESLNTGSQGPRIEPLPNQPYPFIKFTNGKCFFYKTNATTAENELLKNATATVTDFTLILPINSSQPINTTSAEIYPTEDVDFDGFIFVGVAELNCRTRSIVSGEYIDYEHVRHFFAFANSQSISGGTFLAKLDITPLIVESSVRATLENNFVDMGSVNTITGYTRHNQYHKGLADYVYGTFQYSIGSKEISGFSDTYSIGNTTAFGWIKKEYTYIENVWNFFLTKNKGGFVVDFFSEYLADAYGMAIAHMDHILDLYSDMGEEQEEITLNKCFDIQNAAYDNIFHTAAATGQNRLEQLYNKFVDTGQILHNELYVYGDSALNEGIFPMFLYQSGSQFAAQAALTIFGSGVNFSFVFFDIKYQPLNSFNLSYTTNEDVPYDIEQLDGSADAISDFDRLSISTQEKVDRIGNETLTINQRTLDPSNIQSIPCYYQDDFDRDGAIDDDDLEPIKYVIFKRQYTIDNYFFNVNYTGSKDAILKNYFTSIRTKYRAYQYVDYNASILRKEKDKIYVLLSEKGYFHGDDKILFRSSMGVYDCEKEAQLISGCAVEQELGYKPIVSNIEGSVNDKNELEIVKNDVSIVATQNMMALIYEDRDNVGAGPVISIGQIARGGWYGGVLQDFQIWNEEDFNLKHTVYFVNNLNYDDFFNRISVSVDYSNIANYFGAFNEILKSPIVDENILGSNSTCFLVVDRNIVGAYDNPQRTFYKDYAELLNHTIEFIYYTDSKNIAWTEEFIRRNGFMLDKTEDEDTEFYVIPVSDLSLEEQEYENSSYLSTRQDFNGFCTIEYEADDWPKNHPYINLDWTKVNVTTSCAKIVAYKNNKYKDIIAFDTKASKFYVSLNDTRSDRVWAMKDGLIYVVGKVKYKDSYTQRHVDLEDD